jgi:hypothetical protein
MTRLQDARDIFLDQGFLFIQGNTVLRIDDIGAKFSEFERNWSDLPADQYFIGPKPSRFRRHAQLDFNADNGEIRLRPNNGYWQSVEFNPLFGGINRIFSPIDFTRQTETVLTSLIGLAANDVFALDGWWVVNVHFVRTVSDLGAGVPPAPEGPHRDGYDYIALHLISRDNDSGGETLILDQANQPLHTLMMDGRLDTLYMDDRRFRHDVTPIASIGRQCHRDMILMSFERPS